MAHAQIRFVRLVVLVLVLLVTACSGRGKAPTVTPGTGAVGLPPLPSDIGPQVYEADAYIGIRCGDVPSGLNNCHQWLRVFAESQLVGRVRHDIEDRLVTREAPTVEGNEGTGGFSERRELVREVTRKTALGLSLRSIESPILALEDGRNYGMRLLLVRAEAEFEILTALADRATRSGDHDLARQCRDMLRQRFGDEPPSRSGVEQIERRINEYFREVWEMSLDQQRKRR